MINRHKFWDEKILKWENDKYLKGSFWGIDVNAAVKSRMQLACHVLKKYGANQSIIEIGCGSGILLSYVKDVPFKSYLGLDISPVAVAMATQRAESLNLKFPVRFQTGELDANSKILKGDIGFSLGLIDWLSDQELQILFTMVECKNYFHSFSARHLSLQRVLHMAYVHFMYGHRNRSYVPRYRRWTDIQKFMPAHQNARVFGGKELGIGRLFHNFEGMDQW